MCIRHKHTQYKQKCDNINASFLFVTSLLIFVTYGWNVCCLFHRKRLTNYLLSHAVSVSISYKKPCRQSVNRNHTFGITSFPIVTSLTTLTQSFNQHISV